MAWNKRRRCLLYLPLLHCAVAPKPASRNQFADNDNPHAIPGTGTLAVTTVAALPDRAWMTGHPEVGQKIFGPFESGFDANHEYTLRKFGCSPASDGHMPGGIDTTVAQGMIEFQCGVELPRYAADGSYLSMLDRCGGHYTIYHFHEELDCLYDPDAAGHSPQVAEVATDRAFGVFGIWEDTGALAVLDACGAHFGPTPESGGADVYHYHVQKDPPYVVGCFGPSDDGGLVTYEECLSYYPDRCGDDVLTVTSMLDDGTGERVATTLAVDPWCPCYVDGRNVVADGAASSTAAPVPWADDFEAGGLYVGAAAATAAPSPSVDDGGIGGGASSSDASSSSSSDDDELATAAGSPAVVAAIAAAAVLGGAYGGLRLLRRRKVGAWSPRSPNLAETPTFSALEKGDGKS